MNRFFLFYSVCLPHWEVVLSEQVRFVLWYNSSINNYRIKNMKTLYSVFFVSSLLFVSVMDCWANFGSAGFVKSVMGDVTIMSSGVSMKVVENMKLLPGDAIKTGPESSVGLIFDDDTVVSLGSDSEMLVESFMFEPAEKKLSFVIRIIQGTFSFITGQIAKLAPEKVTFETPDATLGVRGTKFLVKVD